MPSRSTNWSLKCQAYQGRQDRADGQWPDRHCGDNNQGKTSVLDSIAWTLGGDKYRPSEPARRGSAIPPNLHIVLSNGLIVERKGKNSELKVTDPKGHKAGQTLLNEFIEQLALDLQSSCRRHQRKKPGPYYGSSALGPAGGDGQRRTVALQ